MSNDLDKLIKKVERLRNVNSSLVYEIESLGGAVDMTMARIENLISFFVNEGYMTPEQQWEEQKSWELRLRPQLISTRDRIKMQLDEARRHAAYVQKQREKTVRSTPPGSGAMEVEGEGKSEVLKLILPPSVKKNNESEEK